MVVLAFPHAKATTGFCTCAEVGVHGQANLTETEIVLDEFFGIFAEQFTYIPKHLMVPKLNFPACSFGVSGWFGWFYGVLRVFAW